MTIKDIVRLSGYSLGTVSRVINGQPNVSDKARAHILSIMEEHNYHPNENAKMLKQQASTAFAIIIRGTQNVLFADIIEQIQILLANKNKEPATVHYLDEYDDEVKSAIEICKQRHPKGLIFLGGNLSHFQESFHKIKIPTVLLTNSARTLAFPNLSSFTTDDQEASNHVIRHFIEQGHKNIAIIGGNLSSSQISYHRIQGAVRCLKEHNIPFNLKLQYEPCRYSLQESYPAMKKLLERFPQATAVFALSDITAIGAMRAAFDMGLSIPEDISIIGFDGIALSRYSIPRLSTIYQSRTLIAQRGVEELIRMHEAIAQNQAYEPIHETLPYHFLEGESVKKIK